MPDFELARFPLANGGSVIVEVDGHAEVARAGRPARVVRELRGALGNAVAHVSDAAAEALAQFTAMSRPPDEVELKFGMKLDVEAGAVIARTGVQGQFEVKLKWRRDDIPVEEEVVEES
ncbi:CU044_2847 family protein [Actinokineospora sp. HUAS TT18]|uniref:CU044_2847 family protein n=1 Tax=Actinokineospora sp. HUAS TT18 TaxID=3447451 RepID=UPI003F52045D